MWEEDWNEAITQCEDILIRDGKAYYGLEKNTETVFSSENLRSKEVLFAYQFSKNVGGGGTVSGSTLKGHPVSVYVTSQYRSMSGCIADSKYGGYGFGRVYPNQHLLSYIPTRIRERRSCLSTALSIMIRTRRNSVKP